ncbi:MAG: hypothetical protein M0Z85_08525 [Gammaproteobacteria bacterium]|nr:hypothetical protein [Gammaproteobacteria bacterium]
MPRKPTKKSGPMSPAERQREKRARDRAKVWSPDEDLKGLSDTGLLEQLAIAFRKERDQKRGWQSRGAITRGLMKEVERRLKQKP